MTFPSLSTPQWSSPGIGRDAVLSASSGESSWGRSTEGDCTGTATGRVSSRGRKHLHSEAHVCVSGVGWGAVSQSVSGRIFSHMNGMCVVFFVLFLS